MFHPLEQPGLVKLIQQAQHYQALLGIAQAILPDTLKDYLVAVSLDQNTLVCMTTQAHWASKLRFFEQPLLQAFRQHLPHIELHQVRFKVNPIEATPARKKRPILPPSTASAEAMRELSQQVHSEKLAKALLKLSRHATPN